MASPGVKARTWHSTGDASRGIVAKARDGRLRFLWRLGNDSSLEEKRVNGLFLE